ncbi:MAG: STAS domain-containing protein [Marinilabiliaceae bacterium]|nr:STAS domain-containing protein [Marinilabiliaceae bacterium]
MLTIKEQEGIIIGTINETDRLIAANATKLKSQLNDILIEKGIIFILDLHNIRFIDSTGIGALISALKTARQNDCTFQLNSVQQDVFNLLALMKLDKVFDIN